MQDNAAVIGGSRISDWMCAVLRLWGMDWEGAFSCSRGRTGAVVVVPLLGSGHLGCLALHSSGC